MATLVGEAALAGVYGELSDFTVLIFLPLSFCLPASVLQEEEVDRTRAAER